MYPNQVLPESCDGHIKWRQWSGDIPHLGHWRCIQICQKKRLSRERDDRSLELFRSRKCLSKNYGRPDMSLWSIQENRLPHLGDRLFVLRCRPHPQSGTVTGDTSVCVKWNCDILAMLDYYTGAAKCQGGIIQDQIHGRVTNSHSPYCHVLELLYTDNLRMKWCSFRSFQHFYTSS